MYYILAASIHSDYAFPGQTYRIQHEMPIKIANLGTTIITQTDHETQHTTNPIKTQHRPDLFCLQAREKAYIK